MSLQTWIAYATLVFVVIIAPGPAAALCMTHASTNGSLRTLFTIAGLLLSSLALIGLSAAGLGAALAASGTLFTTIKLVGAAYLVYLGIQIWRSPPVRAKQDPTHVADGSHSRPFQLLRTGFLVGVSNPKDLLFFGALFPQFMSPDADAWRQLVVLTATWVVIAGVLMFCYAVAGFRMAVALERLGPRNLFNRITGGALVAIGASLALFRRSSS
ncbi:MAG TPA: LysE family translocator [Ramlibacter sp.]|nr:LysE family translocator [Aquabacterium sp.]HYF41982.1 LysE family translocator [Ramlibacter sp.]